MGAYKYTFYDCSKFDRNRYSHHDFDVIKQFFTELGGIVEVISGNQIKVTPSNYVKFTSQGYYAADYDEFGDDLTVYSKLTSRKCNSGLYAFEGQLLYSASELEWYIKNMRPIIWSKEAKDDGKDNEGECCFLFRYSIKLKI